MKPMEMPADKKSSSQNDATQEEPQSPSRQNAPAPAAEKTKQHRTFGNKVFDLVLWPLVMGGGVWLLSYFTAKEGTIGKNPHFNWLRKGSDKFTEALTKMIEPVNKEGGFARKIWKSESREWAKNWTMWSLVSIPGTALTPVMQFFENHRKPIADHIDQTFHKTPHDPDNIKPEPKQTTASMLAGRGLVTAGAASTMLAFGPKGMDAAAKKAGSVTTEIYKFLRPNADKATLTKVRNNSDIAVFDMILTSGATAVMYFYSRHAARKKEIEEHRHERAESHKKIQREEEQALINSVAEAMGNTTANAETEKTISHASRIGDRPADYRSLAEKEPASPGMALS